MEKSSTLNLRINADVKKNAENILGQLGISMSTAIDMYLRQITLTGGIPFMVNLPEPPKEINTNTMTDKELKDKLQKGYNDIEMGNVNSATEVFKTHREKY
ncbi:MAG: type II toxin-antitoxin system RelB/DinJ family antitoxin [Coprobacillaceae bacterium]